ncbi:MAG: hypothetical protein AB1393_14425 [Candidatus Edwardsbacteria bacterium]
MTYKIKHVLIFAASAFVIQAIFGCVPKIDPFASYRVKEVYATLGRSLTVLSVEDRSGKKTSITPQGVTQALVYALERSGLFVAVQTQAKTPDLKLKSTIENQNVPLFGYTTTARLTMHFELIEVNTSKTLMDVRLIGNSTKTPSDAFLGATRVKLACEGAVSDAIDQLLPELDKALRGAPVATAQLTPIKQDSVKIILLSPGFKKIPLAVYSLDAYDVSAGIAAVITEELRNAFRKTGIFDLVEKSKMEILLSYS